MAVPSLAHRLVTDGQPGAGAAVVNEMLRTIGAPKAMTPGGPPGGSAGGTGSGRHRDPFPRPRRAVGPVLGTLAAVAAWFGVAHSSGSGWVQALGALLAGCIVVGLIGPAFFLGRTRCWVEENPADAVAGFGDSAHGGHLVAGRGARRGPPRPVRPHR